MPDFLEAYEINAINLVPTQKYIQTSYRILVQNKTFSLSWKGDQNIGEMKKRILMTTEQIQQNFDDPPVQSSQNLQVFEPLI